MEDFGVEIRFPRDAADPNLVIIAGKSEDAVYDCIDHLRAEEEEYLVDHVDRVSFGYKYIPRLSWLVKSQSFSEPIYFYSCTRTTKGEQASADQQCSVAVGHWKLGAFPRHGRCRSLTCRGWRMGKRTSLVITSSSYEDLAHTHDPFPHSLICLLKALKRYIFLLGCSPFICFSSLIFQFFSFV